MLAVHETDEGHTLAVFAIFALLVLGMVYATLYFSNWAFKERKPRRTSAADESLYDLTCRVAHDLRSPLTALNMVAGTLTEVPENKRQLLCHAAKRINDITSDLLEHGKTAHRSKPTLLGTLVDRLLDEKRFQYRDHPNLRLLGEFDSGYGLFVNVDQAALNRTLSNLIDNAVEACGDAGLVTVAVARRRHRAVLEVRDDGKGIKPEILERLGQKGFTYGKPTGASGLGIGLFYAREMLTRAGGRLDIRSRFGFGTTVTLTLPRISAAREPLKIRRAINDFTLGSRPKFKPALTRN